MDVSRNRQKFSEQQVTRPCTFNGGPYTTPLPGYRLSRGITTLAHALHAEYARLNVPTHPLTHARSRALALAFSEGEEESEG